MKSNPIEEFISREEKQFKIRIGKHLASSLSGFIAGAIFATIVWITAILIFGGE